jgi:hypothetical protein
MHSASHNRFLVIILVCGLPLQFCMGFHSVRSSKNSQAGGAPSKGGSSIGERSGSRGSKRTAAHALNEPPCPTDGFPYQHCPTDRV